MPALIRWEQQCYNLTHNWGNMGYNTFPRGINPKVNIMAQLEFELAYLEGVVQHFSYNVFKYFFAKVCIVSVNIWNGFHLSFWNWLFFKDTLSYWNLLLQLFSV